MQTALPSLRVDMSENQEKKPESGMEGRCVVCEGVARLKCSNCRNVFYCSKEHQRINWSSHKSECNAWVIRESPELGRHLIATRDLVAGDLIVSEVPLVWGPAAHVTQRVCVGCGKTCSDREKCARCAWPVCSNDCDGLVDKNRHGLECAFLAKANIVPRCQVLLALRMLLLWKTNSKRWDALSQLQSHEESRGRGTDAYHEVMETFYYLEPLIMSVPECKTVLPKICGLIDVNALDTAPPEGSVAVYEHACLLEHSCLANTRHSFSLDDNGRPRITVKAIGSIKKGEHLSTMYTHALWSTRIRRQHLLATKYFNCCCKRCTDPTELGTHIGTVKCPCKNGVFLPKNPLELETDWVCDSCPGMLTSLEVAQLTDRLEEEVDDAMEVATAEGLADLLARLTALLHPGHQHCISVSHSLIQLLPSTDPQKIELCKRIINTVTTLDPHGARLALYTAIALRELAQCTGQDKRSLLARAATLLKQEPQNSPGEKLLRVVKPELESLS